MPFIHTGAAKNTPICGMLQTGSSTEEALAAFGRVVDGDIDIASSVHSEVLDQMRKWYPGILECLEPIRNKSVTRSLPEDVRGILRMLLRKLRRQYFLCNDRRTDHDYRLPEQQDDERLGFFPNWPIRRGYGNYATAVERGARDEADTCTKYRHGHKVLGPGIMLYLCPHSVCYGFSIMDSYESPRMPFETFTMRNYIPDNVVYDNACKLHVYALNREPELFSGTRFVVDRFHFVNHDACAIGYDMNRYACDPVLCQVNSQANEQLNSRLQQLRRSLSYMTLDKFMLSLKLYLYLRNRSVKLEL